MVSPAEPHADQEDYPDTRSPSRDLIYMAVFFGCICCVVAHRTLASPVGSLQSGGPALESAFEARERRARNRQEKNGRGVTGST
jgi:hypothetical protein